MTNTQLYNAVEQLARTMLPAPDAAMDRPWAWGAYDEEGVRFAALRAIEELRELAVLTLAERDAAGSPPSGAQRILAQYHAAYRELEAVLLGNDDIGDTPPAEGEWPLRQVLAHILEADMGFFVVVRYALDQHRGGVYQGGRPDDPYYDSTLGLNEEGYRELMARPLPALLAYYAAFHARVLDELSGVQDAELELPSRYWEGEDLSLRFRLHRFESHLRQHTIQAEKTLAALDRAPSEARRLALLLYRALAEAEGAALGAPDAASARRAQLAEALLARAGEVAGVLRG